MTQQQAGELKQLVTSCHAALVSASRTAFSSSEERCAPVERPTAWPPIVAMCASASVVVADGCSLHTFWRDRLTAA